MQWEKLVELEGQWHSTLQVTSVMKRTDEAAILESLVLASTQNAPQSYNASGCVAMGRNITTLEVYTHWVKAWSSLSEGSCCLLVRARGIVHVHVCAIHAFPKPVAKPWIEGGTCSRLGLEGESRELCGHVTSKTVACGPYCPPR